MGLVSGILTVMAGFIYVVYQYRKENPGALTIIVLSVLIGCGPLWLFGEMVRTDTQPLVTIGVIGLIAHACFIIGYLIHSHIHRFDYASEEAKEQAEIWAEVNALPLPDQRTLQRIKAANKLPEYPEDSEIYNKAAINLWRQNEFNRLYERKHKFVVYHR